MSKHFVLGLSRYYILKVIVSLDIIYVSTIACVQYIIAVFAPFMFNLIAGTILLMTVREMYTCPVLSILEVCIGTEDNFLRIA